MNHLEVAALRQRNAQLRGVARQLRGNNAQLRTLLRRSLVTLMTVAEGVGPERIEELDDFLAQIRTALELSGDADRDAVTHIATRGPRRP